MADDTIVLSMRMIWTCPQPIAKLKYWYTYMLQYKLIGHLPRVKGLLKWNLRNLGGQHEKHLAWILSRLSHLG